MALRQLTIALLLSTLTSCDPVLRGTVVLEAARDPSIRHSLVVLPITTTGVDRFVGGLADVAGDIGAVENFGFPEQRLFLLSGDLSVGIGSGEFLHFPHVGSAAEPRRYSVSSGSFSSVRVYSSGVCSSVMSYAELGRKLGSWLIGSMRRNFRDTRDNWLQSGSIEVTLRASNANNRLSVDRDTVRWRGRFVVDHVTLDNDHPFAFDCGRGTLDVSVLLAFSGTRVTPSRREFRAVYDPANVSVRYDSEGYCAVEGNISDAMKTSFLGNFGDVDGIFQPLTAVDVLGSACTRSDQCEAEFPGSGACIAGQCHVALGVDRLNFRPDGLLELVSVDTPDEAAFELFSERAPDLVPFVCAADRYAVPASAAAPQRAPSSLSATF